ncbi:MAG: hypothetical protein U5N85_02665 [Arcicella sp.]|nr:hypothetical protein [Arcicella sp.]
MKMSLRVAKENPEKIKVVVPSTFTSDYIKIVSHPTKKVTICKNSVNAKILSVNRVASRREELGKEMVISIMLVTVLIKPKSRKEENIGMNITMVNV